ncbi:MAG: DnaJ domain-containing protein [Chloroflexi bacterium]|nr:DnaJ domain-containing protein [Chloroflexota bacterium]
MEDLYLVLGIEPDAKPESIRERFRFLAQAYHPDKFSSTKQKEFAEEEFKKINNAYQILSNPSKRANYDLQRVRTSNYSRTNINDITRKAEETAHRHAQEERAWQERKRKAEEGARRHAQEEHDWKERKRKADEEERKRARGGQQNTTDKTKFYSGWEEHLEEERAWEERRRKAVEEEHQRSLKDQKRKAESEARKLERAEKKRKVEEAALQGALEKQKILNATLKHRLVLKQGDGYVVNPSPPRLSLLLAIIEIGGTFDVVGGAVEAKRKIKTFLESIRRKNKTAKT